MIDPQWRLGEGYELLATYPAGAGGTIWLVRVRADGTERAIKILRPELTSVPEAVHGFSLLLDSVRGLGHPGILVADETVVDGNRIALVMRRMPGGDLRTLLNRQQVPKPTPASIVLMVADLCDALAAAHAAGIVHGDVKPSNVLLDSDPGSGARRAVRLTDIGLAALAARSGVAVQPAEYLAPEIGGGGQPLTPASDVYAVGILLYEALAGHPPFTGKLPDDIGRLHREAQPPRVPEIPDPLWPMVASCLDKNPQQRPTAAESATLLREIAPTVVALSASATDNTVQIARITAAVAPRTAILTSVTPAVPTAPTAPTRPAVPTAVTPTETARDESPDAPRRSVLSGPRGIALGVFSGVAVFAIALALINTSGNSPSGSLAAGSANSTAQALGGPSVQLTSTVTTALTPTSTSGASASATRTPSPSADGTTGSATPSTSSAPTNSSAATSTAAVASATPSTAGATATHDSGSVTVNWQCATNQVNHSGISKTSCIGIGSDGGLYVQGMFTESSGQTISDIKISLAQGGQYLETNSESCGAASCSITGGPYSPPAGTYQAYAGIDGSSHNEVSPQIAYQGG